MRLTGGMVNAPRAGSRSGADATKRNSRLPAAAYAFISDVQGGVIYVLNDSGTLIAELAGHLDGPQGMAATGAPALYVANSLDDSVVVYTPSTLDAPLILSDTGRYPTDVAVDGNGNVATADYAGGTVSCFAQGATSPTKTISGGGFAHVQYDAFDASGNLYILGYSAEYVAQVGEIVGGCQSGTAITRLETGATLAARASQGGIQVTPSGNIAILDGSTLYAFAPPVGGSLGSPVTITALGGTEGPYDDPVSFAFTPGTRQALVVDGNGVGKPGGVARLYAFPEGGSPIKQVALPNQNYGFPAGVAIVPTQHHSRR